MPTAATQGPPAPPDDVPTGRSPLRDPRFLRLWCGTTASGLATWALPFVLGLGVLDGNLTATDLGLVLAARTVGFLLAVPLGGVLADRFSRRAVVLVASLVAAAATPVVAVSPGGSIATLLAAAAIGAGQGSCRPAFQALVAEVVEPDQRQQANAAITFAVRVSTLVAPAGAVAAAALADITGVLWLTAVLWLISALLPPRGRHVPTSGASGRSSFLRDLLEGVREARRHPWFLAGLAALTTVIATGYSATSVALPLVSRDHYGSETVLAGAATAYVVGALAGAVLLTRWRPRAQGWIALTALAGYAFAPASLLVGSHPAVVYAGYAVAGLGIELFNVPWFTATQREVAPDKLARVSALDFLLSYGLAPVGLALIGPAIDEFGVTAVLAGCAAACVLAPAAAASAPGARDFHHASRPPGGN